MNNPFGPRPWCRPRPRLLPLRIVLLGAFGVALLLLSGRLPAQEPFYRDASPEVTELRRLYGQAGRVFPQGSTPISRLRLAELAADLEAPEADAVGEALSLDRPIAIRAAV